MNKLFLMTILILGLLSIPFVFPQDSLNEVKVQEENYEEFS
jgi:hypothetical protein